jgi:hypothetical protein
LIAYSMRGTAEEYSITCWLGQDSL